MRSASLAERTAALRDSIDRLADRNSRRRRNCDRRGTGRRRPAGRNGGSGQARHRLDARRRGRGERANWPRPGEQIGEQQRALRRAARERRRRRRRRPVQARRARLDARPGRARSRRASAPRPARRWSPSLVQVKEAAAHAAERAREAIEAIIPESAGKLSEETRAGARTRHPRERSRSGCARSRLSPRGRSNRRARRPTG